MLVIEVLVGIIYKFFGTVNKAEGDVFLELSWFSMQVNCSVSGYSALLVGAYSWITVILNGLPWK